MAFGDKFFPTSSSSIFGDLRTFKRKCSRAILAVTLEGVRLSLTALLTSCRNNYFKIFTKVSASFCLFLATRSDTVCNGGVMYETTMFTIL